MCPATIVIPIVAHIHTKRTEQNTSMCHTPSHTHTKYERVHVTIRGSQYVSYNFKYVRVYTGNI